MFFSFNRIKFNSKRIFFGFSENKLNMLPTKLKKAKNSLAIFSFFLFLKALLNFLITLNIWAKTIGVLISLLNDVWTISSSSLK